MLDFKGFPYPVVNPSFAMAIDRMANLDHSKLKYCVWHHTGGGETDVTAASTNRYHIQERGWAGIGYHGLIRWNGTLELGRPLHKQGVHASKVNAISLGFCMSGNFEIGDIMTRPDQYKSGVALAKLVSKMFPGIQHVRHKDVGTTLCNGKNFPWEQFIKDIYTESDNIMSAKQHIVQPGETMYRIARDNGIPQDELVKFNPHIHNSNVILAEHGGDIIFLEEPNIFEVEFAAMKGEVILCKLSQEDFDKLKNQLLDAHKELDAIKAEKNGILNDLRSILNISMKYA